MKTLTFHNPTTGSLQTKRSCTRIARVVVACIFAAGIALSDTLHSTVQYGIELEKKQDSLTTITEDTRFIEDAFKQKVNDGKEGEEKAGMGMSRLSFPGQDIAALIPSVPQPTFQMRTAPHGTLTPQGNTGVVDRGFQKQKTIYQGDQAE